MLESVSGLPHLFPALEETLFSVIEGLLNPEGLDLIEEVLEILAYFTFFTPEVHSSPELSNILFLKAYAFRPKTSSKYSCMLARRLQLDEC